MKLQELFHDYLRSLFGRIVIRMCEAAELAALKMLHQRAKRNLFMQAHNPLNISRELQVLYLASFLGFFPRLINKP